MSLSLIPPGARKGNRYFLVRGRFNGRLIEESTGTIDEKQAGIRLREIELRLLKEGPQSDTYTVGQAIEEYKALKEPRADVAAALHSVAGEIGDMPAAECNSVVLAKVAKRLFPGTAPSTRNRYVIVPVAAALHLASKGGHIPWLRIEKLEEPRPIARDVPGTVADALIASADGYKRRLLAFLFRQGWRLGDTLALSWHDVSLPQRRLRYRISKTDDVRYVPLAEEVAALLEEVPPAQRFGRVFPWSGKRSVYRWLKPYAKRLGVKFTPHMARHTFATTLVGEGAELADLMYLGGWRDVKSVMRYGRTNEERARALINRSTVGKRK